MSDEYLLQGERAVKLSAIFTGTEVDDAGWAGSNVDTDRDIQLPCKRPIGSHSLVVRRDFRVLIRDLRKHAKIGRRCCACACGGARSRATTIGASLMVNPEFLRHYVGWRLL